MMDSVNPTLELLYGSMHWFEVFIWFTFFLRIAKLFTHPIVRAPIIFYMMALREM